MVSNPIVKIYDIAKELAPIDVATSEFTLSGLVKDKGACGSIFEMAHTASAIQHQLNRVEHEVELLKIENQKLRKYIKNNKLSVLEKDILYNLAVNK